MKKQTLYIIVGVVFVTLACTVGTATPAAPTQVPDDPVGTVVALTMQAILTASPSGPVPTQAPSQASGIPVTFQYASFTIPNGLAGGASPEAVAAIGENGGAPWEVGPAHLKFTLTGYQLQDKFHEPQILVYPADELAQANSGAAEQIDRLKKILAGGTPMKETLPAVYFFNAAPLIAADIQPVAFQSGKGIRTLTQYDQYAGPVNNHEFFYHFQGLTNDGKYYIIAILPITAPILPEDAKADTVVPPGGVPIPADTGPNSTYYISVTGKLNALSPDAYTPSLSTLDTMIQSILVTNP